MLAIPNKTFGSLSNPQQSRNIVENTMKLSMVSIPVALLMPKYVRISPETSDRNSKATLDELNKIAL